MLRHVARFVLFTDADLFGVVKCSLPADLASPFCGITGASEAAEIFPWHQVDAEVRPKQDGQPVSHGALLASRYRPPCPVQGGKSRLRQALLFRKPLVNAHVATFIAFFVSLGGSDLRHG